MSSTTQVGDVTVSMEQVVCPACGEIAMKAALAQQAGTPLAEADLSTSYEHTIVGGNSTAYTAEELQQAKDEYKPVAELWYRTSPDGGYTPSPEAEAAYNAWSEKWGDRFFAECHDVYEHVAA